MSPLFLQEYIYWSSQKFSKKIWDSVKSFSISWDTIVAISQILKHIGLVVKLRSFYSHLQTIFPLMIVGGFHQNNDSIQFQNVTNSFDLEKFKIANSTGEIKIQKYSSSRYAIVQIPENEVTFNTLDIPLYLMMKENLLFMIHFLHMMCWNFSW